MMRAKLTKQKNRHSEFISESSLQTNQILKRVQDDSHIKGGYRESRQSTVRTGFTIVEIIFVIAIGGLILVMSFMAISSGQRSKRDAQRKTDLSRINQAIIANANQTTGGILPTHLGGITLPTPPNGGSYIVTVGAVTTTCSGANRIYYERTSDRSYKIKICLESGDYTEEH